MEGKGHSSTCDIDTFVSLPQNICIWPDVDGIPCKHPHITYKLDIAYCQTVHLFMLFMLMNAVPLRENGRNEQTTNSHSNGDKNPHSIWISNLLHADIRLQTLWRGQPKAEVEHRRIAFMHLMNVDFEVNREKKNNKISTKITSQNEMNAKQATTGDSLGYWLCVIKCEKWDGFRDLRTMIKWHIRECLMTFFCLCSFESGCEMRENATIKIPSGLGGDGIG